MQCHWGRLELLVCITFTLDLNISCFQTLRASDKWAELLMADIKHKNTGVTSEVNELSS